MSTLLTSRKEQGHYPKYADMRRAHASSERRRARPRSAGHVRRSTGSARGAHCPGRPCPGRPGAAGTRRRTRACAPGRRPAGCPGRARRPPCACTPSRRSRPCLRGAAAVGVHPARPAFPALPVEGGESAQGHWAQRPSCLSVCRHRSGHPSRHGLAHWDSSTCTARRRAPLSARARSGSTHGATRGGAARAFRHPARAPHAGPRPGVPAGAHRSGGRAESPWPRPPRARRRPAPPRRAARAARRRAPRGAAAAAP